MGLLATSNAQVAAGPPLDALSHPVQLVNPPGAGVEEWTEAGGLAPSAESAQQQPQTEWLPSVQCDELHVMSSEPEKLLAQLLALDPQIWTYRTLPEVLTMLNDTDAPEREAQAHARANDAVAVEAPHLEPECLVHNQKATLRRKLFLAPPANSIPLLDTPAAPAND